VSRAKSHDPFADVYGEFADRLRGDRWLPDVDIFETEKDVIVRVELAGVRGEDLSVTVDGRVLKIRGVRRGFDQNDLQRLHQVEIATGPFERRIQIPVAFRQDPIAARLADGFLTVVMPKKPAGRQAVEIEGE
jgi:HSP20 family protein